MKKGQFRIKDNSLGFKTVIPKQNLGIMMEQRGGFIPANAEVVQASQEEITMRYRGKCPYPFEIPPWSAFERAANPRNGPALFPCAVWE